MDNQEKRINYNAIVAAPTLDAKVDMIESEVARIGGIEQVCLTDVLVNYKFDGGLMMKFMEAEETEATKRGDQHIWRLKVLRDEWGKPVKAGEYVVRKITRSLRKRDGTKLGQVEINDLKRRGEFDKRYVDTRKFLVDDQGRFSCPFVDAIWFLSQHGVAFDSRMPLCGRREVSSGQVTRPDGQTMSVWYWRYEEVPPWEAQKQPQGGNQQVQAHRSK